MLIEVEKSTGSSIPVKGNAATGALYVEVLSGGGGGAGTSDTLETTQVLVKTNIGAVTETAPATDTASSGLNGRLQRVAQHLTNIVSYTSRLLSSTGPKAAGSALATTALQIGGTHNTSLPTMTNTQEGGLQLDANGRVLTSTLLPAETSKVIGTVNNAAGETHIGEVAGNLIVVSNEITLQASGAYAAGDIVSDSSTTTTPLALAAIMRVSGGTGYIVGFKLTANVKSITPRIRIHFFNANTTTVSGDNLAYKELYADASKRLGYYDMPAMITAADTANSDMSRAIDFSMRIPIKAVTQIIYAVFETLDAVTFGAGAKMTLTAWVDNN